MHMCRYHLRCLNKGNFTTSPLEFGPLYSSVAANMTSILLLTVCGLTLNVLVLNPDFERHIYMDQHLNISNSVFEASTSCLG